MQTRGVRGQKIPKNANVICERPITGFWNRWLVSGPEWYEIVPGWSGKSLGLMYNHFEIIPRTVNWSGTFFAVCYSNLSLVHFPKSRPNQSLNKIEPLINLVLFRRWLFFYWARRFLIIFESLFLHWVCF